jgi:hypothetical protein
MTDLVSNQTSMTVRHPAQVDLLMSVTGAQRAGVFMGREHTLGTAAAELSIPASSLAYWVKQLLAAKLITITRLEPRAGRAIPHYRAVADEFIVPFAALSMDARERFVGAARAHMFEQFTTAMDRGRLQRNKHSGVRISMQPNRHLEFGLTDPDPPTPTKALESWGEVGLTVDEHAEFTQALEALIERFGQGRPTRGRKKYVMMIGLTPAPGEKIPR